MIAAADIIKIRLAHIGRIGLLLTEAGVTNPGNVHHILAQTANAHAC